MTARGALTEITDKSQAKTVWKLYHVNGCATAEITQPTRPRRAGWVVTAAVKGRSGDAYPTYREFAAEFRELWEAEILDQAQLGYLDDLLWFWEENVIANVSDGNLPAKAEGWAAPAWLRAMNTRYVASKAGNSLAH